MIDLNILKTTTWNTFSSLENTIQVGGLTDSCISLPEFYYSFDNGETGEHRGQPTDIIQGISVPLVDVEMYLPLPNPDNFTGIDKSNWEEYGRRYVLISALIKDTPAGPNKFHLGPTIRFLEGDQPVSQYTCLVAGYNVPGAITTVWSGRVSGRIEQFDEVIGTQQIPFTKSQISGDSYSFYGFYFSSGIASIAKCLINFETDAWQTSSIPELELQIIDRRSGVHLLKFSFKDDYAKLETNSIEVIQGGRYDAYMRGTSLEDMIRYLSDDELSLRLIYYNSRTCN